MRIASRYSGFATRDLASNAGLFLAAVIIGILSTNTTLRAQDVAHVYERTAPSVLVVLLADDENRPLGHGSAFLISTKGDILTNWHVIEGAGSLKVRFVSDSTEYPVGRIIATGPDSLDFVEL